ncbi:MAG: DNA-binding response regulator [Verrucomicrobia bacterium]|nr:MAG: DNA-binding response regulator [Verrucomicrobiota bacterium]
METQVSLIEDEAGLRRELVALVEGVPGFRCLAAYPDAESALADLERRKPDLIFLDINLPGMSGIDCLRRLKQRWPDLPVVMLTVYEDSDTLFASLLAGADGYLVKRTPRPRLIEALREVCAGGAPMSRRIARKVVEYFHQVRQTPPRNPELETLTPREYEILEMLSRGLTQKEIAARLDISFWTVQTHIRRIYKKLHVHSCAHAVARFLGR